MVYRLRPLYIPSGLELLAFATLQPFNPWPRSSIMALGKNASWNFMAGFLLPFQPTMPLKWHGRRHRYKRPRKPNPSRRTIAHRPVGDSTPADTHGPFELWWNTLTCLRCFPLTVALHQPVLNRINRQTYPQDKISRKDPKSNAPKRHCKATLSP